MHTTRKQTLVSEMESRVGKMEETQEDLCVCPSFKSYSSSDRLAELASKVTDESSHTHAVQNLHLHPEADENDDFDFTFVRVDSNSSPANEFFYDGQIKPIFPIFNRDLLLDAAESSGAANQSANEVEALRIPLKKLFMEERGGSAEPPSSSSSEADELEAVPPGTYCVWRPKPAVDSSPSWCKKSKSTGSTSKRWKFRDLLRRSNSDGKDSFVFLTPKHNNHNNKDDEKVEKRSSSIDNRTARVSATAAGKSKGDSPATSAHEAFYVRNRAIKEGDKRKSYLPYRKDLVGFFANVNTMGRTFPPF